MIEKTYNVKCDAHRLEHEILEAGYAKYPDSGYVFYAITLDQLANDSWQTTVLVDDNASSGEKAGIDAVVAAHIPIPWVDPSQPVDSDARPYVRAESRPIGYNTIFTYTGDVSDEICGGTKLQWNFNNTDNDVGSPPTGYKQKLINCTFIDPIRLKEGTIYWLNMPYDSCVQLYVSVPNYAYYRKNDGTLVQNTTGSPKKIHIFAHAPMLGDCPMGDELNTEAAAESDLPAGAIINVLVTVPDSVGNTDDVCGVVLMELYRTRTVILE